MGQRGVHGEETARIYFDDENASTTVNLIPAIIVLGILFLLGLKLAGIPIMQSFGLDGLVSGEGGFEERGYATGYGAYDDSYTREEFVTQANEALANQVYLESGAQTSLNTNLIASS